MGHPRNLSEESLTDRNSQKPSVRSKATASLDQFPPAPRYSTSALHLILMHIHLHGHYSVGRVFALEEYVRTTAFNHAIVVCIATVAPHSWDLGIRCSSPPRPSGRLGSQWNAVDLAVRRRVLVHQRHPAPAENRRPSGSIVHHAMHPFLLEK